MGVEVVNAKVSAIDQEKVVKASNTSQRNKDKEEGITIRAVDAGYTIITILHKIIFTFCSVESNELGKFVGFRK